MSRPSHNSISSGNLDWDADVDADFDLVFTDPVPLAAFANKAALPAAGDNDQCLAITLDDDTLWISDGTEWTRVNPLEVLAFAVSDETTTITTGTAVLTFRMPYGFKLLAVKASLTTASTSGVVTVDINEAGSSVLSTKLSIDQDEKTSTTAATPAVISDAALADDAEITIDIDAAGSKATGLKVYLLGRVT